MGQLQGRMSPLYGPILAQGLRIAEGKLASMPPRELTRLHGFMHKMLTAAGDWGCSDDEYADLIADELASDTHPGGGIG